MKVYLFALAIVGMAVTLCCKNNTDQSKNSESSEKSEFIENSEKSEDSEYTENSEKSTPPQKAGYQIIVKNPGDSARVEELLKKGSVLEEDANIILFYARQFLGQPYVGYTLDQEKEEALIINTQELDCTTFVENVLALVVCTKRHQTTFADFCKALADVRYIGGKVAYTTRQHYFTTWISDNIKDGFLADIELPKPPLSATRKANVNYMTTHVESYKMLDAHRQWLPEIKAMEQAVSNTTFSYIPKDKLANSEQYRKYIHSGDIIGIVTNKKGLDASHLGFAVWKKDGLHLMHASSVKKEVIEDSLTLYKYLQIQTSSAGIRVVTIK